MRNHFKVIIFIPIFLAVIMVLGTVTLVGSANQLPQSTEEPLTNSTALNSLISYLPISTKNYCFAQPVESPFSISIAAMHQITPTNVIEQQKYDDQYYAWYNQAFPLLVDALKDTGAGWTRIVIRWFDIEPNDPLQGPPVYNEAMWQWYDAHINEIAQTGVKIIAVINSPPDWANNNQVCPAITSDHLQDYQQFLTDLVTRYSQPPYNIKTWEIFNEADNTTLGRGGTMACFGDASPLYAQVLSVSYPTIKSIDPTGTVLMSGLAYDNWTEYKDGVFYRYFPDDVMATGGAISFDALNFHYFPDFHDEWERWGPPENPPTCSRPPGEGGIAYDGSGIDVIAKKNFFTNRMSACYSVNKPVWLTELAEHGVITDTGTITDTGFTGSLYNQAYYVIKGYTRSLAAGIKNITWYALANPSYDKFDQSLLVYNTTTHFFDPKPAYFAFKTLISQLTNYRYDRTISFSGGEAYVFKHTCLGEKIVAWGSNVPFTVSPATTLEVTDYSGNVTTIQDGGSDDLDETVNGSIQFMLREDPMTRSKVVHAPVPIPVYIRITSP